MFLYCHFLNVTREFFTIRLYVQNVDWERSRGFLDKTKWLRMSLEDVFDNCINILN